MKPDSRKFLEARSKTDRRAELITAISCGYISME